MLTKSQHSLLFNKPKDPKEAIKAVDALQEFFKAGRKKILYSHPPLIPPKKGKKEKGVQTSLAHGEKECHKQIHVSTNWMFF